MKPSETTFVPTKQQLTKLFDTWGRRHPLHSHPYLDEIFDPRMNDIAEVRRFCEVLFRFCERFHDCLFALGCNAPDDTIRRALVDNLHDEFGRGDPKRAHLELMRELMRSIGYTDDALSGITLNPGAERFMKQIFRVCRDEHPLKGIGLVCMGAECNGSEYFRRIHTAFQGKSCLRDADLYILEIHAGDDVEHRARMMTLIEPYLDDRDSRRWIHEGYLASVQLFNDLWTAMAFYGDTLKAA